MFVTKTVDFQQRQITNNRTYNTFFFSLIYHILCIIYGIWYMEYINIVIILVFLHTKFKSNRLLLCIRNYLILDLIFINLLAYINLDIFLFIKQ